MLDQPRMSARLFSPDSVLWRVNRESVTGLAGARALMLELAHPLIAAGVAHHSEFRHDPFGRLYRTLRAANDIVFGTQGTANRAAVHIRRCHQRVQGALEDGVGSLPPGSRYNANDPELKLWVLATLVDSILLVYDLFVRPLSLEERRAYYRDSRPLASVFDIPADLMPDSYDSFAAYVDAMISSDVLVVGDTARQVVKAIFAPPLAGRLARALSFAGIGLLPPGIREGYGFAWSDRREKILLGLARFSRRMRRLTPSFFCVNPHALIVELRSH